MKKTYLALFSAAAVLSLATACTSRNMNESAAKESSLSTSAESSSGTQDEKNPMGDLKDDGKKILEDAKDTVLPSDGKQPDGNTSEEHAAMTGTIHEIKDFMFTLTTDGTDYAFSFEPDQKPEGLSDVKEGDSVTVTYTGTVNEVDAFSGRVLSVKKNE